MLVRPLLESDTASFRALRLEGLKQYPDAFGASWEEEAGKPDDWFKEILKGGSVLGCEVGVSGRLVGIAGLYVPETAKLCHRGTLWGMYVIPEARRLGAASKLVQGIIALATDKVEELTLNVGSNNSAAFHLYRRSGFSECYLDRGALKVDGSYVDEIVMRLSLRNRTSTIGAE